MPLKLNPESHKLQNYLQASDWIDCQHPSICELAARLSSALDYSTDTPRDMAIAKRCFEFVRDEIKHSADFGIDIVTCKASDVLRHKTGFCYAKSHLLAALLRANQIPAGLCYQRLSIQPGEEYASTSGEPYCLHGLNAIYLDNIGWYRVDARGNKAGVQAEFCPPCEKLAFELVDDHECDFATIYREPLDEVVAALTSDDSLAVTNLNLPDRYH